jgi:GalNAc-alpha-(1->4)-GalNAc-alpha-(1->3)-diNAcBac-PP-undecaprenol alpha-1,4-N-acetyl-D-galactosaminyltransferase
MRIALINPVLSHGGAGRAMVHMANHWAMEGHTVFLFSFEPAQRRSFYPLHPNVALENLALEQVSTNLLASLRNNLRRFARIRQALREVAPDAAVSFIDTGNIRVILALLLSSIPLVVSERVHPAHERIAWPWRLLRRLAYPLARAVVVQTADIAHYVNRWGLRHVQVIPNPVVALRVEGGAPQIPRPYILAMGRLQPQKSFDRLLHAFAKVAAGHPAWSLAIAGDGPLFDALTRQAQTLGLSSRIHLLGQQADVGGLLARADLFALSSTYEGFPNALCEAMAAGVASIATDCPSGPADIITHDQNGLLVDNANTAALAAGLDRLMSDPGLRQRLGSAATEVAETFSLARVMDQWDQLLAKITA